MANLNVDSLSFEARSQVNLFFNKKSQKPNSSISDFGGCPVSVFLVWLDYHKCSNTITIGDSSLTLNSIKNDIQRKSYILDHPSRLQVFAIPITWRIQFEITHTSSCLGSIYVCRITEAAILKTSDFRMCVVRYVTLKYSTKEDHKISQGGGGSQFTI